MNTHTIFYYACLIMLGVSALIGIAAVWIPSFWDHREAPKLMWTSIVIFAVTLAGALITRWLGS